MDRRSFIAGVIGAAAATPAAAALQSATTTSDLRGTLGLSGEDAALPAGTDRVATVQAALDKASAEDREVILPAGTFVVSELVLPKRTRLSGVAGATTGLPSVTPSGSIPSPIRAFRGAWSVMNSLALLISRVRRLKTDGYRASPLSPTIEK